jgi:phosphoketolase
MAIENPLLREPLRPVHVKPRLADREPALIAECTSRIEESVAYAHEHLEDQPEIRDWAWAD